MFLLSALFNGPLLVFPTQDRKLGIEFFFFKIPFYNTLHCNFLHFSGVFYAAIDSQLPTLDPNYFILASKPVYLTTVLITLLQPEPFYSWQNHFYVTPIMFSRYYPWNHLFMYNISLRECQTKLCHHPPPSTANHHQPKYIHHHPSPPTISQDISTTTHHNPPTAKTFFIRNPFIRISSHCLTAT